jgi:hypothetical protein
MPGFDGTLVVAADPDTSFIEGDSLDHIRIDVESAPGAGPLTPWESAEITRATGAEHCVWATSDGRRQRLFFHPDADVAVEET